MDVHLEIKGLTPLLMHNSRLADPLDPATIALKAATDKKKKTHNDHLLISELEFMGSLYWNEIMGPCIPTTMVKACYRDAARGSADGKKITQGFEVVELEVPLQYDGPRSPQKLFKDANFVDRRSVRNRMNRIMRTRPIFRDWQIECNAIVDESLFNFQDICKFGELAGRNHGLGDFRPTYGRFEVKVTKNGKS